MKNIPLKLAAAQVLRTLNDISGKLEFTKGFSLLSEASLFSLKEYYDALISIQGISQTLSLGGKYNLQVERVLLEKKLKKAQGASLEIERNVRLLNSNSSLALGKSLKSILLIELKTSQKASLSAEINSLHQEAAALEAKTPAQWRAEQLAIRKNLITEAQGALKLFKQSLSPTQRQHSRVGYLLKLLDLS